ncbi:hypothetical protein [Nucisporomicrobium flavum]|jgi:hypothetical protein|uniref:hypothetical protein n=1 Tax=Nucisporomicrobium flavum TaxID=2785915 RepID=UPI0018F4F78E|nr:hypothetical protein [Nucisporomicrobium flavum]
MRILALATAVLMLAAGCADADRDPVADAVVPPSRPPATPASPGPKLTIDSPNGLKGPVGALIPTGLHDPQGDEYVIYGITGGGPRSPKDFGFAIGFREPKNKVTADDSLTEWVGSPSAPGFHPMNGQKELGDGSVQPAYGYYAGTPATITVQEAGRPIQAHLARWSHDPTITVFWFDPADVHDDDRWAQLAAYDASGNRLPDGRILRM